MSNVQLKLLADWSPGGRHLTIVEVIFISADDHSGIRGRLLPPDDFQVVTMISSTVTPEHRFFEHPDLKQVKQMVRDLMG